MPKHLPKMTLIIKSPDLRTAFHAAKMRGISLSDLVQTSPSEVRGRASPYKALNVQRWYMEETPIIPGFGHSVGTLLYFNMGK